MKKLQDLTIEEIKELYNKNNDFHYRVNEDIREGNMLAQSDQYDCYFATDHPTSFRYYDNYDSFYYSLVDAEKFADDLQDDLRDYFMEEDRPHYEKLVELDKIWKNMSYEEQDTAEGEEIYSQLETEAKSVLSILEDYLHGFEKISDDQVEEELEMIISGDSYMGDWETDGEKVCYTETHTLV